MTLDATDVTCPDCQAPPSIQCRGHLGTHAERERTALLQSAEKGLCSRVVNQAKDGDAPVLCGRPLIREVDGYVRHYLPDDIAACPPMPDPSTNWEAYAEQINAGVQPGYPGVEHFVPLAICPDCRDGKHPICTGQAFSEAIDAVVSCQCPDATHTP